MDLVKDLVIIGGGPAGITAAIYAARKRLNFCLLTREVGGQTAWTSNVENYTGYQVISGPDLVQKFYDQLKTYKIDLREGQEVKSVEKGAGIFIVKTAKGEEISAKTLVIASGKYPKRLGIPGEAKFSNKGVAICATCDGPMFADKAVAVVGGGNSALDAALQMMKIASKIYLVNLNDKFVGDQVMLEKVKTASNIEILYKTKTLEILGDKFVNALKIEETGKVRDLAVEGVFVEIGLVPNTKFIDFLKKNENGEIIVNCFSETSEPGVFAAGDVTEVPDKQIIIAAGDGAKACLGAFRYLSSH